MSAGRRRRRVPEVVIDARWLHLGGLGTYTFNLLARLSKRSDEFALRAIVSREGARRIESFCNQVTISKAAMYSFREQAEIPRAARGADLLHVLHYNAPLLYPGPLVVSILDLIHISDPVYRRRLSSMAYARPMLHLAARKAKHIITISEFSKAQLIELLGTPASKISVIYCGANPEFRPLDRETARETISTEIGIRTPYILYLGNLKPHKNVSVLFRAMANLRSRGAIPHELLIVGDDARWGAARREECVRIGIGDITHFVAHVPQQLLPTVYAAADVLVMPSTLEGFGLPVLEAMSCGVPVISSRAASMPEVGGDAVVYFDPLSAGELANAIERVLSSSDLRESLRARGLERAKLFDWDESVRRHVEVYHRVLGSN